MRVESRRSRRSGMDFQVHLDVELPEGIDGGATENLTAALQQALAANARGLPLSLQVAAE